MNRHNFAYTFFLFTFLFIITAFQFNSFRRTAILEERIGELVAKIGNAED